MSIKSSSREKSEFVQQLCRHISKLEETNISLHESIARFQREKSIVCDYFAFKSWDQLLGQCQNMRKQNNWSNIKQDSNYYYNARMKLPKEDSMKKTGLIFDSQRSHQTSTFQSTFQKLDMDLQSTNNDLRTSIIDKLSQFTDHKALTLNPSQRAKDVPKFRVNTFKRGEFDGYESPIESESRIVNKSIRGETDRDWEVRWKIDIDDEGKECWMDSVGRDQQFNQFIRIEEKMDDLDEGEEMMLLSIQNTKLRQKINKLEAIIQSKDITEKYSATSYL